MESETQPVERPVEPVAALPSRARRILAATMAFESVLVMGLALRDFALIQTPLATIGSMTLLAISGVSAWAAYETWVQADSWMALSLLSQFSVAALAVYIVLIDLRSPFLQFWQFDWKMRLFPITGVASILGLFAIGWVLFLMRRWHGPITAGMKAFATLVPLIGFAQFWFQTDYLPRTSVPVVDVSTELSPLGQTGDIVQLEAKVTINNRNTVPVYVGATLMRITAYPQGPGKPTQVSDAIEFGMEKSHAYRDKAQALPVSASKLLYAKDVLPAGTPLAAGQSLTVRNVVDFDSHTMRLARLAVDAFFITNPRIAIYTCPSSPGGPQRSTKDGDLFEHDIRTIMVNADQARFLCREIRLAPQNVVHEVVGDRPSFVIEAIFSDPQKRPDEEYPRLLVLPGANKSYDLDPLQHQRVLDANPPMQYDDMAVEYSPSGESAPPKQK
jgi:hypothetical protein